ncbi:MAG: cyclomaltodextrinase / maltogenic alpha-amylase / neopullulanase [Bacillota bacterium]|nr:cyclomaltodextrinase / maltogenic alpha-amylase / neopullulanase [Bacillota bacterium]
MNRHAILHRPDAPTAYAVGDDELEVVLRAARGDLCRVEVVYGDRYTRPRRDRRVAMTVVAHDELFDYWTARITLAARRFRYYFVLDDGRETLCYGEEGFRREPPVEEWWRWSFQYPYLWFHDGQDDPPDWAQDAIVYQVFVERFANGDPTNDPPGVEPWGATPTRTSFFGGDLQGIIDHLDHLARLGVSCLYLTPIFESPTNHKYDTTDYYRIDPHFGDEELARRLVDECHMRGIRVILDAVFNHSGFDFFAFQDVLENGEKSPYFHWFRVWKTPIETRPRATYETFGTNLWRMPKLATDNPEVQDYLLGVAEHWTRTLGIDGWRLDVGDEVDPRFWRRFRERVRAINPDALIVGEVLHDAPAFVRGDQMDCYMNYPWRDLVVDFFAKRRISPKEFADGLASLRMRYRRQVDRAMWNLIDSHDRERFLTACGGDRRRMLLATTFQFMYTGTPYIYYGDEVGMEGEHDPDCRRCMPWDRSEWDREMLNHYRTLARLRRRYRALRRGEYATLVAGSSVGELFAFARWDANSCVVVLMNNTEEPAQCDPDLVRRRMAEVSGLKRWAASAFRPVLSVGGAQARNLGAHNSGAVAPGGDPAAACHSHVSQYIAQEHHMGAAAAGAGATHAPGGLRPGFLPQGGAAPSDGPSGFAGPNSLEGLEQSLSTPLGWQRFAVSNGLESPDGRDAVGGVTEASTNPPCAWPPHPGRIHLPPMSALVYISTRVSE